MEESTELSKETKGLADIIRFTNISYSQVCGSTVGFRFDFLPEGEIAQKFILILYAVFLVMYIELSSE